MKDIIDFSSRDLLLGYTLGIFPMANSADDDRVMWVCPKKRGIIPIENLHISKSLRRKLSSKKYHSTFNKDFFKVVSHCRNRKETWINNILVDKYTELHKKKFAHSVEIWLDEELVGGLFGVSIGACFFGESMFSELPNTSKFCLLYLVAILKKNLFSILDSQFYNEHLIQFGAFEIENKIYLEELTARINDKRAFTFIENFQEALSLLQPNSHKS